MLVALLHGLALLGLLASLRQPWRVQLAAPTAGVLILLPPLDVKPARPQPARPAASMRPALALPSSQHARPEPPDRMSAALASTSENVAAATPLPAANAAPASAAASSTTVPSLLDNEATRRAVRMATREPLLSERAAAASADPGRLNAQQRLGQEIAQAANGDCLKGEYAGGGMGLLSLPFWLAAEVRGKCRR